VLTSHNAFDEGIVNVAALGREFVMPDFLAAGIEQAKVYACCVMRPNSNICTAVPQGEAEW
jgi:hypothetical protein